MKKILSKGNEPIIFLAFVNIGTFIFSFSNWMMIQKLRTKNTV